MPRRTYKVIFAAGGTGGHLFPAQGLAEQIQKNKPEMELLFAGANLSKNIHFDKTQFSFYDITSMTPFGGNIFQALKSLGLLFQGIFESFSLLSEKKPDLVIGFGSFHSFPVVCAAVIKKIPLVLFESNSIPGKVIKFFSKKAIVTGIYFEEAKQYLKGKTVEVEIPFKHSQSRHLVPRENACHLLGLDPNLPTLLVFGGSQGAKQINEHLVELLPILKKEVFFQLIHLTGDEEFATRVHVLCTALKIPCFVKKFETRMNLVWSAADLALCRSGAMTLSEILYYEVPAILVPYPFSSDQHQLKNALFLEQKVGGAIHFPQQSVTVALLFEKILRLILVNSPERFEMKKGIKAFKSQQKKEDFSNVITTILERNENDKK
jgi:UDP-N-acetylglucosamine--N-acetylmuramyl-(pentapeptide) pyrophosphoryl-undecaprenol N-acetylglucosamine transferase